MAVTAVVVVVAVVGLKRLDLKNVTVYATATVDTYLRLPDNNVNVIGILFVRVCKVFFFFCFFALMLLTIKSIMSH